MRRVPDAGRGSSVRDVDGYCERTSPGFWAEPLNAWTNLAFALAAAVAVRALARRGTAAPDLVALVVLLAAIAVGSFAFHTLATSAAALADTLPIAGFAVLYAVVFARRLLGVPWRWAWLAAPAFAAVAVGASAAAGALGLRMPGIYLAALAGMVLFTGLLAARRDPARRTFALVSGLFAVSLTLRQLDAAVCPALPVGTHFAWHLLNATVLGLLLCAAVAREPQPVPPVTASR